MSDGVGAGGVPATADEGTSFIFIRYSWLAVGSPLLRDSQNSIEIALPLVDNSRTIEGCEVLEATLGGCGELLVALEIP